jgi:Protein of unknown function (DUF2909)
MKTLIVVAFIGILIALASAGVFMLRKGRDAAANDSPAGSGGTPGSASPQQKQMARALAWRVGISVTLFLLVMLAWQMGWIQPSGLPLGR